MKCKLPVTAYLHKREILNKAPHCHTIVPVALHLCRPCLLHSCIDHHGCMHSLHKVFILLTSPLTMASIAWIDRGDHCISCSAVFSMEALMHKEAPSCSGCRTA